MGQTRRNFDFGSVFDSFTGGSRLTTALLLVGLGIFLFFWPSTAVGIVVRIVGAVLILLGVQYLATWYRVSRGSDQTLLILGAAVAVIGLFLVLSPGTVVKVLNVAAGIFLLIHGVTTLGTALAARQNGSSGWIFTACVACVTIVLGLMCLFTHTATNTVVRIVGASLIVNGVMQYISLR